MSIFQPVGQKRHTNIAVVRTKKMGKKFEVACYKNTVMAYRSGVETNVDDVLQSKYVYANVSKGIFAAAEDIKAAFGTDDQEQVCLIILKTGDYQVSDKERASLQSSLFKDVCTVLCDKTVNPDTNRPYALAVIEQSLRDNHFNVDVTKTAKQQALQTAFPLLQKAGVKIARAKMRVKVKAPDAASSLADALAGLALSEASAAEAPRPVPVSSGGAVVWEIEPSDFRHIDAACRERGWTMEVLELSVREEGDAVGAMLAPASFSAAPSADGAATSAAPAPAPRQVPGKAVPPSQGSGGGMTSATAPGVTFASREELKAHLKSDWHRMNLKRKSKGLPMLSKEEAEGEALLEEMEKEKSLGDFM